MADLCFLFNCRSCFHRRRATNRSKLVKFVFVVFFIFIMSSSCLHHVFMSTSSPFSTQISVFFYLASFILLIFILFFAAVNSSCYRHCCHRPGCHHLQLCQFPTRWHHRCHCPRFHCCCLRSSSSSSSILEPWKNCTPGRGLLHRLGHASRFCRE